MNRKLSSIGIGLAILLWTVSIPVFAAGPNFNPAIYADGQAWGTKGLGPLPAPNGHNDQSFDKLYLIEGQLPVAEAAPGNPDYNGGRWSAQSVTWTIPNPPLVTSFAALEGFIADGYAIVTSLHNYFECPLLPTK